jgi:hypothetical protein
MVVDVPRIKSKWVGESEKNIKALFDRYREQVKRSRSTLNTQLMTPSCMAQVMTCYPCSSVIATMNGLMKRTHGRLVFSNH